MLKYLRVIAIVLVSLAALSGTANALSVKWYDVELSRDGTVKNFRTTAQTVGAFLDEQEVLLAPHDFVTPGVSAALDNKTLNEITVTRGFNVTVSIDGKKEIMPVRSGTRAGEVLSKLENEHGVSYTLAGAKNIVLQSGDELRLSKVHVENTVETLPLMYDTEIILDDQLEIGNEVIVQEGNAGTVQIASTLTYMGGELVKTQVMSESVIEAPVTEVVRQGTKKPLPKVNTGIGSISYTRVLDMIATAYSAHFECTGKNPGDPAYGITATGMPVNHGVVAVDPSVIPLGTRLYVEGYGVAIAADTGSAIKGNKIDLYHESLDDARRYGRRNIKVYVLE